MPNICDVNLLGFDIHKPDDISQGHQPSKHFFEVAIDERFFI
jgi:hypothetical protein